jgi:Ca-activated chloride channel family protein
MKLPPALDHELLLAPDWLWLWPAGLIAWFAVRLVRGRALPLPIAAPAGDFGPGARRGAGLLRHLPGALLALAGLAACYALAEPALRRVEARERPGLDIVLCIDRSSSMAERDLDPARTRLEVARDAALEFIARRPEDRIGLVGFARYDDLLAPPTEDRRGLAGLLSELTPVEPDGPEDATGFGGALARAAETLGRGRGRARVAVLLTDGEENVAGSGEAEAIAPDEAAQLAASLDVRLYAIAVGRTEPIGADGRPRPLDTRALRATAERSGGVFFAAADAAALEGVYAAIELLEDRRAPEPQAVLEPRPAPWIFLAGGLSLLALALRRALGEVWP